MKTTRFYNTKMFFSVCLLSMMYEIYAFHSIYFSIMLFLIYGLAYFFLDGLNFLNINKNMSFITSLIFVIAVIFIDILIYCAVAFPFSMYVDRIKILYFVFFSQIYLYLIFVYLIYFDHKGKYLKEQLFFFGMFLIYFFYLISDKFNVLMFFDGSYRYLLAKIILIVFIGYLICYLKNKYITLLYMLGVSFYMFKDSNLYLYGYLIIIFLLHHNLYKLKDINIFPFYKHAKSIFLSFPIFILYLGIYYYNDRVPIKILNIYLLTVPMFLFFDFLIFKRIKRGILFIFLIIAMIYVKWVYEVNIDGSNLMDMIYIKSFAVMNTIVLIASFYRAFFMVYSIHLYILTIYFSTFAVDIDSYLIYALYVVFLMIITLVRSRIILNILLILFFVSLSFWLYSKVDLYLLLIFILTTIFLTSRKVITFIIILKDKYF